MTNKKRIPYEIIGIVLLCCAVMAAVDGILQPGYAAKSAIKICLFLGVPLAYSLIRKPLSFRSLFQTGNKGAVLPVLLGLSVYAVIVLAYLVLRNVFDFSNITKSLTDGVGVTRDNFIWVALYISFANSLLEEFFFRGFAFLTLRRFGSRKAAYAFSAGTFALYHVAMLTGWFSLAAFLLAMAGLFIGGLLFNYLNEKRGNILSSWMVHMAANFATNTIGFVLFGQS